VDERRVGRPFKFRNKVGNFGVEVIRCGSDLIIILQPVFRRSRDGANPVLNFKGLANPAAIFPIDEFLTAPLR